VNFLFLTKVALVLTSPTLLTAQVDPAVQAARRFRQAHEREIVANFMEFLSIPNVPSDPSNYAETRT
jgi:hypothetical protein